MCGLKLHLGCGENPLLGWVNIDTRMQPGVDRVDNIGILKRYKLGSVSEIYCSHALDHFSRWDYPRVLRRWRELLCPDGLLRLSVIDFAQICKLYLNGTSIKELTGCLVAAQDYDSNVRHMHWDFESLQDDLILAGFREVSRWESTFDDCSTAQVGGVLISLNMVGVK